MTNEQKLIALAKLDGWSSSGHGIWANPDYRALLCDSEMEKRFSNGDEIRRLIGKQPGNVIRSIERGLNKDTEKVLYPFLATTEQLAELLLRATGNWVE